MKSSLFWLILATVIWVDNIPKKELQPKVDKTQKFISFSQEVITVAKKNLGKPYEYGKIGPESFDCSGFVYGIYKQLNVKLPRTSLAQSEVKGSKIPRNLLQTGDLLFFDTAQKGKVNHSGIYIGEGKFIHASSGKANAVTISNLDGWYKDKFKWGKRLNAN